MTHDPLAQFRKTPITPKEAITEPTESEGYMAFGAKNKAHRLRICSTTNLVHSPGYNLLLDVVSDGEHGTNCILVYTVLLVMVRGKNLQKMVFAIESGMAEFIQAFDPDRWEKPKDETAAFIESIEIKVTEGGSRYGDTQH